MDDETTTLLRLAAELRKAAADAGRADVVAKADEVIALLTTDARRTDKSGALLKFLDGLGL